MTKNIDIKYLLQVQKLVFQNITLGIIILKIHTFATYIVEYQLMTSIIREKIISLNIDVINYKNAISKIIDLAEVKNPAYVCFANVHMVIEAYKNKDFANQVNNATLVLADGVPVAKSLKFFYGLKQERIAGMDAFPELIELSGVHSLKIFLFGSTDEVLNKIQLKIKDDYPRVNVVGAFSPPFNKSLDDQEYIDAIKNSEANLVFVALGCPKQENWMSKHSSKINAVLLGVGGAFPVFAGINSRAPAFIRNLGFEWLYRLSQEPGRLFKRYFKTNSMFILLSLKIKLNQFVRRKKV